MKYSTLFSFLVTVPLFYSCSQNGGDTTSSDNAKDTVYQTSSYRAIDGKDTAQLTLKTFTKKVTGNLVFAYYNKDKNEGFIEGAFSGDTLFADYVHTVGKDKTSRRNPLAFLKKDGKLILGVGKIESVLGRNYLSKTEPIDFDKGRFTFEPFSPE